MADDSGDDVVVRSGGGANGFFSDLVEEAPLNKRRVGGASLPANAVKASWSFRDAIDRIDAADKKGFKPTSLQEKVAQVRAAAATPAVGGKRPRAAAAHVDDDESESAEDSESGNEDNGVEESDEDREDDESDSDNGSDDDDGGNDDDSAQDDDDDDGTSEKPIKSNISSQAAAKAPISAAAYEGGGDDVAAVISSARPNPFRERSSLRAAETASEKRYSGMFAPDPFSAAARGTGGGSGSTAATATVDAVRAMEVAAAPGKNRATEMAASASAAAAAAAAAAGAGDLSRSVVVTGLAPGTTLREPRTFAEMNLSRPLLRAVADLGYQMPTPIQRRCVPLALAGHDICGSAVTGSGKTAAYLLPLLERLQYRPAGRGAAIRVIVLTPTRELAAQVHSMCAQLGAHCRAAARAALVVGGMSLKAQETELRARPDIVIATPGRLLDHLRNSLAVHCEAVDVLVLDEADRLLEMGFEAEVLEIVRACPPGRQTLLFSATMSPRVEALAQLSLRRPVRVIADPLYDMAARLSQEFLRLRADREGDREATLLALVTRSFAGGGVLIFAAQKRTAHRLAILLALAGLRAAELHGNLTQRARLQALEDFRAGAVDFLIATDLAGRGLDIAGVRAVINYEMPTEMTAYVHRVGRTARAGRAGVAVTLVSEHQRTLMKEIVRRAALNVKARVVPPAIVAQWRERIEGWASDIDRVLAAEREERALRMAHVEVDKADNLIRHADEIAARPPRTWFQTEREKAATRAAAAAAVADNAQAATAADGSRAREQRERAPTAAADRVDGRKKPKTHRLTRAKRRRLEARADEDKDARRVAKAEKLAERAAAFVDREERRGGGGGDAASAAAEASHLDPEIARIRGELRRSATANSRGVHKQSKADVRATALRLGLSTGMAERVVKREKAGKKAGSDARPRRQLPAAGDDTDGPRAGAGSEGRNGGRLGKKPKSSFKSKAKFKRRG